MMIHYEMIRGNQRVAEVFTLNSGKCIVSWPTSVVVYDSEDAARAVHIDHMGGRGERTAFVLAYCDSKDFNRGYTDAIQDDCEGCPFASIGGLEARDDPRAPKYGTEPGGVPIENNNEYLLGYVTFAKARYGSDWRTCTFGYAPAIRIDSEAGRTDTSLGPKCTTCGNSMGHMTHLRFIDNATNSFFDHDPTDGSVSS